MKMKLAYCENNVNTANLYLQGRRIAKISALNPAVVNITNTYTDERVRVENFIKDIYKRNYNADIQVHYPVLMSVRNAQDEILAAAGFRYAAAQPLFLEQYVGMPLENILHCPRERIVEIGNLASGGQGASIFLFAALASYLNYKNISYAAVTGTDFLHRYFKNIGLEPHEICNADVKAIACDGQNWGSYYDTRPRVLVDTLAQSIHCLERAVGAYFEVCDPAFISRLHYKGGEL